MRSTVIRSVGQDSLSDANRLFSRYIAAINRLVVPEGRSRQEAVSTDLPDELFEHESVSSR
jgi:hypothetical protein